MRKTIVMNEDRRIRKERLRKKGIEKCRDRGEQDWRNKMGG
jgi:hypothetical protein